MNGIGGSTIAEAKSTLSYTEARKWASYRAKRGSLNTGQRVEWSSALLATLYANAHSKDGGHKIHDFAPHHEQPETTLEEAMKLME